MRTTDTRTEEIKGIKKGLKESNQTPSTELINKYKRKYRKYCKLFLENKITISQYREMEYISDIVQRKGWNFFAYGDTHHLTIDLWFSFDKPCLYNEDELKQFLNLCVKQYIEQHKRTPKGK